MDIRRNFKHNAVVIAHLFYKDIMTVSIDYFKYIPKYVDLIITTPKENIAYVKMLLREIDRDNACILPAGPKGRDVAALLVTARKYLMKYDYLCFIHDKKTTGGRGDYEIGARFQKMIWQNILGDASVIEHALHILDKFPEIGVLAPPAPYQDEYFLCMGDPWSTSLGATQKVLDMLKIDRKLSINDIPRAFSTAFWCRTLALQKLFSYPFHYNDFPDEPMPLNGAFNHGVEHAISFIAEDAGFKTMILAKGMEKERIFDDYDQMLSRLCRALSRRYFFNTFEELIDEIENNKLMDFCQSHDNLYIYGAGYHGLRLLPILANMGYNARGFIVSDGCSFPDDFPFPIYHLSDISQETNMGCIVAAAQSYRIEMKENLKSKNWNEENIYFLQ